MKTYKIKNTSGLAKSWGTDSISASGEVTITYESIQDGTHSIDTFAKLSEVTQSIMDGDLVLNVDGIDMDVPSLASTSKNESLDFVKIIYEASLDNDIPDIFRPDYSDLFTDVAYTNVDNNFSEVQTFSTGANFTSRVFLGATSGSSLSSNGEIGRDADVIKFVQRSRVQQLFGLLPTSNDNDLNAGDYINPGYILSNTNMINKPSWFSTSRIQVICFHGSSDAYKTQIVTQDSFIAMRTYTGSTWGSWIRISNDLQDLSSVLGEGNYTTNNIHIGGSSALLLGTQTNYMSIDGEGSGQYIRILDKSGSEIIRFNDSSLDSGRVDINRVVNLKTTTNSNPKDGDFWYDGIFHRIKQSGGDFIVNGDYSIKTNRNYSVPTSTDVNISWNYVNGTFIENLLTSYIYRFRLVTLSTGTETGATYIVWHDSSSGNWQSKVVSQTGTASNHPLLKVTGTLAQVYHLHPSAYTIKVISEAFASGEDSTTPDFLGADNHWTKIGGILTTDNSVNVPTPTSDSNAATKLYVDTEISSTVSNYVTLNTTQTITGAKTIDNDLEVNEILAVGLTNSSEASLGQNLSMGATASYSWLQSWNSRPLRINGLGNAIEIGSLARFLTYTNSSPSNGDIWFDGSRINFQGDTETTGYIFSQKGAFGIVQTGLDVNSTSTGTGHRILTNNDGRVIIDHKTNNGLIQYRCGNGTELGSARTWLEVDSTNGITTFNKEIKPDSVFFESANSYAGMYWGELKKNTSTSSSMSYIRQGTSPGELEFGSDNLFSFYETDARTKLLEIDGNNQLMSVYSKSTFFEGLTVRDASDADGVHIISPKGGIYRSSTSSLTGYLKITLPTSWNDTMFSMDVDIYDYAGDTDGESIKLRLGGYNHVGGGGSWYHTFAHIISGRSDKFFNVRYGHDGSKCAIYIGESNSTWSYPQVIVHNVNAGFSGADSWINGVWDIGVTTSLGTITKTSSAKLYATHANVLTTARTIALAGDLSGGASFDGSSNITINASVINDSHSHSNYVDLTGAQSISGTKTFSSQININKSATSGTSVFSSLLGGNGASLSIQRDENANVWEYRFGGTGDAADNIEFQYYDTPIFTIGTGTANGGASLFGNFSVTGNISLTGSDNQLIGGFGANTTGGTLDWNHSSNARSGNGTTLLTTSSSNRPQLNGDNYWHPFSFEYNDKDGTGNMTQFAIPYRVGLGGKMSMRSRVGTAWSDWSEIMSTKPSSSERVYNLPTSGNTSLDNGDIWFDGTTINFRDGGTTKSFSDYVDLTSDQTINGIKTFNSRIESNNSFLQNLNNVSGNGLSRNHQSSPTLYVNQAGSGDIQVWTRTSASDTYNYSISDVVAKVGNNGAITSRGLDVLNSSGNTRHLLNVSASDNGYLSIRNSSSSDRFVVDTGGNYSSTGNSVYVRGNLWVRDGHITSHYDASNLLLRAGTTASLTSSIDIRGGSASSDPDTIIFNTESTQRARVDNSGIYVTGRIENNISNTLPNIINRNSSATALYINQNSDGEILRCTKGGTANAKFTVSDNGNFRSTGTGVIDGNIDVGGWTLVYSDPTSDTTVDFLDWRYHTALGRPCHLYLYRIGNTVYMKGYIALYYYRSTTTLTGYYSTRQFSGTGFTTAVSRYRNGTDSADKLINLSADFIPSESKFIRTYYNSVEFGGGLVIKSGTDLGQGSGNFEIMTLTQFKNNPNGGHGSDYSNNDKGGLNGTYYLNVDGLCYDAT